jgi:actin-binding LIM protein
MQVEQHPEKRCHTSVFDMTLQLTHVRIFNIRCRFDYFLFNLAPSRHLNRPKPWVFWKDGTTDRSATTQLPCFHLPQSRTGTERAITLPDGYGYYGGTLNSHLSDRKYICTSNKIKKIFNRLDSLNETALSEYTPGPSVALRSSLPDMSKSVKTYPLEKILATNKDLPDGVDRQHLERHLNREEFEEHFGMAPIEFYKLPEWKRINMKRKLKLF